MTGNLNYVLAAAFLAAGLGFFNGHDFTSTRAPAELINRPPNPSVCVEDEGHRRWSTCDAAMRAN